ncbi:MAG: hypothetical protein H8E32_06810 [Nitrospinae bacterium]|nr:hypothetical protein [Nitrospinota bacterium]
MEEKITRQPINVVMVRRGTVTILSVPTQKLKTFIRKRALLGTDEISGDGKSWIRVDRHYQLRKFFSNEDQEITPDPQRQGLDDALEFSENPPNIENNLQQVADLLKDING